MTKVDTDDKEWSKYLNYNC